MGTFFDAGALNDTFSIQNMKYSAGVSGEWLSPFGALSISAAYPINKGTYTYQSYLGSIPGVNVTRNDQTQFFQFNFGQNF